MNKLFPYVFTNKITLPAVLVYLVFGFFICAGVNTMIGDVFHLLNMPSIIGMIIKWIVTIYFYIWVLIAFLNAINVVKVSDK